MYRFIPIYSRFCGGYNIHQVKAIQMPFLKIYDYVRESNSKHHEITHTNNLLALQQTKDSIHAIKLSGLQSKHMDTYIKQYFDICSKHNNKILIDAENVEIQPFISDYTDYIIRKYNNEGVYFYKTYQMYLKNNITNLEKDLSTPFNYAIKLVRGAYHKEDKHTNLLYTNKKDTDAQFFAAIEMLRVYPHSTIIATHNNKSCAIALRQQKKFIYSQLYGMNDNLSYNLLRKKQIVYKYIPYGNLTESIPYLIRRLYENYDMFKYVL